MKVVILAGGEGSRLGSLTQKIPKPLVKIGKKPILVHLIEIFLTHNIKDFIIATGYRSKEINNFFFNLKKKKNIKLKKKKNFFQFFKNEENILNLETYYTGRKTQTGGRILRLKKKINDENFIVTYGDGLSNVNIKKLIKFHEKNNKIATVTSVNPLARFGYIEFDNNNNVLFFREKIQTKKDFINGGFFVFNKKIFNYLNNDDTILEKTPMKKLIINKNLKTFVHKGFWHCMDTPRDKEDLQKKYKDKKILF